MLFALAEPLSALGLAAAFVLGMAARSAGQAVLAARLIGGPRLRRLLSGAGHRLGRGLVDPFGALAAALGGTGWGRAAPVVAPVVGTRSELARRVAVHLAGPVLPVLAGEVVLAGFTAVYPRSPATALFRPSDVLRGVPGPGGQQFLLSAGVGLICFGVFALLPVPPCDGGRVLWLLWRRPGPAATRVRYWIAERNVGVVILLAAMVPLGAYGALAYPVLDAVGTPLVRVW